MVSNWAGPFHIARYFLLCMVKGEEEKTLLKHKQPGSSGILVKTWVNCRNIPVTLDVLCPGTGV